MSEPIRMMLVGWTADPDGRTKLCPGKRSAIAYRGNVLAKVSKIPWRDFDYNLRKARGLMRLQFYAEDLIKTGGKESFGKLLQFYGDMMASFGLEDLFGLPELIQGKIAPTIEKELGPILRARLAKIDETKLKAAAEEMERKILPRIDEFRAIIEEIGLVIERVLLEQALVTAVTALEVYIKDVTLDVVARNRFLERRFTSRLQELFRYNDVTSAEWDLGWAIGTVVAGSYDFYDPKSVARHLKTLMGDGAPLTDSAVQTRLGYILAYRNLIVHQAGLVDAKFRKRTAYKGRLGEPVRIKREFVEEALKLALSVGSATQEGLESLRARP
jgi:hypothetical protein